MPVDPDLPELVHLTSDEVREVLAVAVTAAGGHLERSRPEQVDHRPGRSCTVAHRARVRWSGAAPSDELLVTMATTEGLPDGAVPVEAEGLRIGVWRYPHDPYLPALADLVLPGRLPAPLRTECGGPRDVQVLSYRAGRRAVVRIEGGRRTLFVKVLRPGRPATVVEHHERFAAAGVPVPRVVACDTGRGWLATSAVPGRSLREAIVAGGALPDAAPLVELAGTVAAVPAGTAATRRRPERDVLTHAAALRIVRPDLGERIDALLERVAGSPSPPDVTVHGDLHDGQVMVDGHGAVTGLIDLDDAGTGSSHQDLATLTGNLLTLGTVPLGGGEGRAADLARRLVDRVPAGALELMRRRTSAVVLSLATGPHLAQDDDWWAATADRLTLAEQVLEG